jgi:hypothetical protein
MTQFSAWLRDFKAGAIDDQLTAAMTDVARAVQLLELEALQATSQTNMSISWMWLETALCA